MLGSKLFDIRSYDVPINIWEAMTNYDLPINIWEAMTNINIQCHLLFTILLCG